MIAADSPVETAPAQPRDHTWGIMIALAVTFLVVYFAARMLLERNGPSDAVRFAIALAPLPPFLFLLRGFVRAMRGADELERRVQLEALAFAFPLTLILLMVLGLVELAFPLTKADWSYRHVWAFLPLFYFGGLTLAWRRYK